MPNSALKGLLEEQDAAGLSPRELNAELERRPVIQRRWTRKWRKANPENVAKRPKKRPRKRVWIDAGVRYGKFLVAVEEAPTGRGGLWIFRCDCGKETIKRAARVKNGEIVSCGSCSLRSQFKLRHGHAVRGKKRSPEYIAWALMKSRCNNPKARHWPQHGGRGITVCVRWSDSVEAFLADMGPRPSPQHLLARTDQAGNYEPGNCRWAMRGELHETPG
jgi:hypothetical protein